MGRIAFIVAATLIAGGFGMQQAVAQTDTTKSDKADKQKSTEKKTTTKQTETQSGSGKSAPMSGFRPDMPSNY